MAASFKGWGASWGASWDGTADPNAMHGLAVFSIAATGTLSATGGATPVPQVEPAGGGLRTRRRVVPASALAPAFDPLLEDDLELQLLGVL